MNELTSVMDNVAVPVFVLNADGYYVHQNQPAQDFLGYAPTAMTGKHITDLIVYDPILLMAGFEGLKRKGYFSGGVRYRHRDGRLVDANVNTFRYAPTDGTSIFITLADPLPGGRPWLPEPVQSSGHGLTAEEMRLLMLLASGFSDAQIARLQDSDADDVELRVQELLRMLDASSRTEAVVLALKKRVLL